MTTLAKLVVKLITDVSEFESGMKNATKKLDNIGKSVSGIGDKLTAGVTLPLVAAGVASVKFASDLSESMNKVDVVFGDSAEAVKKFSETSATAMGMSQNSALQALGTFGNLFTSMGMTKPGAADMSTSLVQLASDLASFNNLNPEEVFQKLQSGIVGETEPLRSLGVNISDVTMKAKAMEMGLGDATGKLTEREKIMARYAIIMEQTANAQGDFARTSDGLANSTRILQAELENVAAGFGQALIPAAIAFMQAAIPLLNFFNSLPQPVKEGIVNVLALAAAMGPVLSIGGRLVSLFAGIKGAFAAGGALAAVGPWITGSLVPALSTAVTWISSAFIPAIAAIGAPVWLLIGAIGALIAVIVLWGDDAWRTVQTIGQIFAVLPQYVGMRMGEVGTKIRESLRQAANWVRSAATDFYNAGRSLMAGMVNGVLSYVTNLINAVTGAVRTAIAKAKALLGIHSPSKVFASMGTNMMMGMERGILGSMRSVENAIGQATGAIVPQFEMAPAATAAGSAMGAAVAQPAGGAMTINIANSIGSEMQLEQVVYRMLEEIQRRRR